MKKKTKTNSVASKGITPKRAKKLSSAYEDPIVTNLSEAESAIARAAGNGFTNTYLDFSNNLARLVVEKALAGRGFRVFCLPGNTGDWNTLEVYW